MMMVELTSIPSAALPVTRLADHLRLARGFADDGSQDARLEGCLRAAVSAIEARIGKALYERRFLLTLTAWSDPARHALPLAPVSMVNSVKLVSAGGDETLVDAERYVLRPDRHRPVLAAAGGVLPAPARTGTVEIDFTAGYGADWADVPADLQQATLIMADHFWSQDRELDADIPPAALALLEPFRQVRLSGART